MEILLIALLWLAAGWLPTLMIDPTEDDDEE